jgi:hypothetical protein
LKRPGYAAIDHDVPGTALTVSASAMAGKPQVSTGLLDAFIVYTDRTM